MADIYDHVVIGAGIVGSCTAWHLAKNGKNVLLLEQFHLPTIRGSSHGQSRLIRTCYAEKYFSAIMPEAFALWKEIEDDSNTILIKNTKILYLTTNDDEFNKVKKNMEDYAPEYLQTGNIRDYLNPELIKFPTHYKAILDGTGGVLFSHKAVTAVQGLFKKYGGQIKDGCPVTSIINDGDDVLLTTSDGIIRTHSLIVCAGAWTSKLFNKEVNEKLSKYLQPIAVKVFYWKILKNSDIPIPPFIDHGDYEIHAYGIFSSDEYPGLVKVASHGGTPCDPNERDKTVFDINIEKSLIKYIKERFPMLDPAPAITESCMYTDTPDATCIIDKVPTYRNVYVGCGFSGTGFKTAPIIGKLLYEMALGLPLSHDLNPFSLSRFN